MSLLLGCLILDLSWHELAQQHKESKLTESKVTRMSKTVHFSAGPKPR